MRALSRPGRQQHRWFHPADILRLDAARVEDAAWRRCQRAWHFALDHPVTGAEPADPRHRVQQRLRVGMRWSGEQFGAWRDLHQAAEIQHRHAIHQVVHHAHVMADEQIRQPPLLLHVAHQIEHLALDRHIQRRKRLVCHNQCRIWRQSSGDRDALALAAGELMRVAVQCVGRQADVAHQVGCPLRGVPRRSRCG